MLLPLTYAQDPNLTIGNLRVFCPEESLQKDNCLAQKSAQQLENKTLPPPENRNLNEKPGAKTLYSGVNPSLQMCQLISATAGQTKLKNSNQFSVCHFSDGSYISSWDLTSKIKK